jgi:hypothetical protein
MTGWRQVNPANVSMLRREGDGIKVIGTKA